METKMQDTRPRVALNGKAVDLAQLAEEVGAALTASDTEVVVVDPDAVVTVAQLKAAVDAHSPSPQPDPDADLAASINAVDTSKITDAAAKAALDALKAALVGSGKPAAASGRPTGR
jgi:hypothetical protein